MNFFNIGPMELLLILTVVLIVFGPDKIPDIASSIGKMLGQFRQASKDITEELDLEDLNPSTLADVLEAQAKAEEAKTEEGDSPPALPATTEPTDVPAATADEGQEESVPQSAEAAPVAADATSPTATPDEDETPKQRFQLPPEAQTPPADAGEAASAAKPLTVGDETPKQRFHLPPEAQTPPADADEAPSNAAPLTVDHESAEDAD